MTTDEMIAKLEQEREAMLRMGRKDRRVFLGARPAQLLPDRFRQVEIDARQDHCALIELRDRIEQACGRGDRSRRTRRDDRAGGRHL